MLLAPYVTSALKRPDWPTAAKQALAMGVSVAVGVAAVAMRVAGEETDWSLDVVVGHVATVFAASQLIYHWLLDGAKTPAGRLNERLEALGTKRDLSGG